MPDLLPQLLFSYDPHLWNTWRVHPHGLKENETFPYPRIPCGYSWINSYTLPGALPTVRFLKMSSDLIQAERSGDVILWFEAFRQFHHELGMKNVESFLCNPFGNKSVWLPQKLEKVAFAIPLEIKWDYDPINKKSEIEKLPPLVSQEKDKDWFYLKEIIIEVDGVIGVAKRKTQWWHNYFKEASFKSLFVACAVKFRRLAEIDTAKFPGLPAKNPFKELFKLEIPDETDMMKRAGMCMQDARFLNEFKNTGNIELEMPKNTQAAEQSPAVIKLPSIEKWSELCLANASGLAIYISTKGHKGRDYSFVELHLGDKRRNSAKIPSKTWHAIRFYAFCIGTESTFKKADLLRANQALSEVVDFSRQFS